MSDISKIQIDRPRAVRHQICDSIRELIVSGKLAPGTWLPPTQQLEVTWKTDANTIHKALAPLVKEGWLVRQPGVGTVVQKRAQRLTCVGFYGVAAAMEESLFGQAVQAALKAELTRAGIELDVWLDPRPNDQLGRPWAPLLKAAANRKFQALVAGPNQAQFSWLRKLPVPAAFLTNDNIPNRATFDLIQFADLSVAALADQGCRSVGLIMPARPSAVTPHGQWNLWADFSEHFVGVAHDRGLTLRNEWMRLVRPGAGARPVLQEQFGYEQFLRLWRQAERPDGLVAWPDTVARGVLMGLLEKQVRVPAELKLVLAKNEAVNLLCPMPATFAVSSERELARALIAQVQKQFRGERCEPVILPYRLQAHGGSKQ